MSQIFGHFLGVYRGDVRECIAYGLSKDTDVNTGPILRDWFHLCRCEVFLNSLTDSWFSHCIEK